MLKKIFLWVLVLAWSTLIFFLSAQTDQESKKISISMSEKLVQSQKITQEIPEYRQEAVGKAIHTFVRKTAHFSLYLCLGVLVMALCRAYQIPCDISFFIAVAACLLYAASDELHQLFVPGRSGEVQDALLDCAGSITGVLLYWFCSLARRRMQLHFKT